MDFSYGLLMTPHHFPSTLIEQMFHKDFKQHLKVIETLSSCLENDLQGLTSNLDLILKWITLRFFETNPTVHLRVLEYVCKTFSALTEASYQLDDLEATCFVPYLVNKVIFKTFFVA